MKKNSRVGCSSNAAVTFPGKEKPMFVLTTDTNSTQTKEAREISGLVKQVEDELRFAEEQITLGNGYCWECGERIETDLSCPCHPATEREVA